MACTIDFRYLDEGFGGKTYKRKRSEQQEQLLIINPKEQGGGGEDEMDDAGGSTSTTMGMEVDSAAPASKRQAVASSEDPNKPVFGKASYDGVIAGKVSGRKWKQARSHRSSAAKVSLKGTTFEQRSRQKEIKKAYKERMTELKEEIRQNKVDKRKKREEREKRKQENILRSGTKLQKITNPKTLKKISKSKQRKLLKVVPDHVLKN